MCTPSSAAAEAEDRLREHFVPFLAVLDDDRVVIAAPAGDGRASFVSRDDLADVAAAVLLDDSGSLD